MSKRFHCTECEQQFTLTDEQWEAHQSMLRIRSAMEDLAGYKQKRAPDTMTCPLCKRFAKVTPVTGGCFIATAACDTDQAEDVVRLREFRERVLRPAAWGRAFIALYEFCSPPLAAVIARSSRRRWLVRKLMIHPLRRLIDVRTNRRNRHA